MQIKQHFLETPAPDGKGRGARANGMSTDREGSPGQPGCGGVSPMKKNMGIIFEIRFDR